MIQRSAAGRRAAVAVVLSLAVPVLTGCGLEAKDETSKERSQIQAAADQIGGIRIRNAFITAPLVSLPAVSGTSTKPGPPGPSAYLVVTLVNDGPTDVLTGISTTIGVGTLSSGSVTLPRGVVVQISDPDLDPSAPAIAISGKTPTVDTTVPVKFEFTTAGETSQIQVPVVTPPTGMGPTQVIPTTRATPPAEDAPLASD